MGHVNRAPSLAKAEYPVQTFKNTGLAIQVLVVTVLLSSTPPLLASDGEGAYRLLQLNGYKVKWGEQTLGAGASISYAFADQTMRFENARNCGSIAPITSLSSPSLPLEVLERETAAAFRAWERAANLSFYPVDDASDADIVIGAQGKPVGRAFANVAYAPGPQGNIRQIKQALVCLNPERQWKVGFDGDTDVYDIRYTLIHEIGHAIGLDHPGPEGQVMGFRYTEAFTDLQPGDVSGIRQLYGPSANYSGLADAEVNHTESLEAKGADSDEKGDALGIK
jgi:hypothetical protein